MRPWTLVLLIGCAAPKPQPSPAPATPAFTGLAAGLTTTDEIKARMKEVAAALGVKCDHCHDVTDFSAATPHKRIANLMVERFTSKLEGRDGSALQCATCHQGRPTFLDRTDQEALKRWMQLTFVDKLRQKNGGTVECDTCHDGSRYRFLPRDG